MTAPMVPLLCDRCARRWTFKELCKVCQDAADAVAELNRQQDERRAARRAVA